VFDEVITTESVSLSASVSGQVRKIGNSDYDLRHVCLSVRPSVRVEQLGYKWTDFYEIWYLGIFRKTIEKIQVSLKLDKNNGYFK